MITLILGFLIKVALISSSGALAPGPLTAATAAVGVRNGWKGGFLISVGHTIVEFPLVLLIGFGIATFLTSKEFVQALSFIGGLFLIFYSYLTARDAIKVKSIAKSNLSRSPMLIGISLSALNPFFIAWWVGIGSPLVMEAVSYWGFIGVGILYVAHVWLDFAWLTTLARITSLSDFSLKLYKTLLLILALLVALFGIDFLYYSIREIHLLPF